MTITVPTLAEPKMIDLALQEVNTMLTNELSWLNYAFGKCEKRVEEVDNRKVTFPAIHVGQNEYEPLFPDSHKGNFSFFDVPDASEGTIRGRLNTDIKAKFSLIVWFDFDKVYPVNTDQYTTRNVIAQFTELFRTKTFNLVKFGPSMKYYEEGANIYKGYTDKEIQSQFLMRPFGGFRIEGEIMYHEKNVHC